MPRRRHDAWADLTGWVMLGAGTGLTVGLVLGQWLEFRRFRRMPDDPPEATAGAARTVAQTAEAVRHALEQNQAFNVLGITVRSPAPGMVEVGGWVDDRMTRAQVVRFAQSVTGIREVIDSLLVRGEDDIHLRNQRSSANPRT